MDENDNKQGKGPAWKCKFEVDGKCDNPENEYAGFECILLDPYLPKEFRCDGYVKVIKSIKIY